MSQSQGLKLVALHEFLVKQAWVNFKLKTSSNRTNKDLTKQDDHLINELYEHPATCMSVFRELPEIAKHVIMRILFINQPIARQVCNFCFIHNQ